MLLVLLDILRRIILYERPRRLVVVLGKEVTFQLDGKLKKGLAKEISESGRLQVELEDKHTIWLNRGEIYEIPHIFRKFFCLIL